MNYSALAKMIKDLAKKCGITKKVNPHSFRHARATTRASKMTECQMNAYFGWVQVQTCLQLMYTCLEENFLKRGR